MPSTVQAPPTGPIRVLVAYEGGGAMGLVHVGAMKALERADVEVVGVAGTSAGAIAAALHAAGFEANDLVDPDNRTTLLDTLGEEYASLTDFFGVDGWQAIDRARRFAAFASSPLMPLVLFVLFVFGFLLLRELWNRHPASGFLGLVLAAVLLGWSVHRIACGLSSLDRFHAMLTKVLSRQLGREPSQPVLFRDFGIGGRPTLKIVATDITSRTRHVFSPETTPDVAVADAVAASACLPIIFSPRKIIGARTPDRPFDDNDRHYFDGGIVSNLPTWLFDVERTLDPEAVTLAVQIRPHLESASRVTGAVARIVSLVPIAIFGRNFLNLRAVGRLLPVGLTSPIGVLDFNVSKDKVFEMVRFATRTAETAVLSGLFSERKTYVDACTVVRELLQAELAASTNVIGRKAATSAIRVAVALPEPEGDWTQASSVRYLRLRYGVGFEDHADEGLVLPIEGSFIGSAWTSRQPELRLIREADGTTYQFGDSLPGPTNRFRRKLIWPELSWVLCVPIYRPDGKDGTPLFVISIDGNDCLIPSKETAALVDGLVRRITDVFTSGGKIN